MKQGWHSILRPGVQGGRTSFIGGKPCLPPSVPLPVCKICGEPLTFFFQAAFPEGHMWAGKSLAFFFCSAAYHRHKDKEQLPCPVHADAKNDFDIPAGELASGSYQTMFRAIVFDTAEGVLREDYQERVAYQEIEWEPRKAKDKKTPIILGGEPIWTGIKKYGKERPASYGGKPMGLLLQVAENFNFEKLPDAPPEMEEDFMGDEAFAAREEPNYTLFFEFNRVYLWGPEDPSDPVVYINVQNDV